VSSAGRRRCWRDEELVRYVNWSASVRSTVWR
jgi:hypothetical protein